MAGTIDGGTKAKAMLLERYGKDYYKELGRKGGSVLGAKKGFALVDRALLSEYGRRGGRKSRKTSISTQN